MKPTRRELLRTGLFHEDYSVLHADYMNGVGSAPGCDLVLADSDGIILEYHWERIDGKIGDWFITGSYADFDCGYEQIYGGIEEVLDLVTEKIKIRILFHLDLFV